MDRDLRGGPWTWGPYFVYVLPGHSQADDIILRAGANEVNYQL